MTPHAPTPGRSPSLGTLLLQIETAWIHDRNADLPVRLAEEHPDVAAKLLDFFDDLVLSSIVPSVDPDDRAEAADCLGAHLRQTGRSALADAIERSSSLGAEPGDGDSDAAPGGDDPPLKLVSPSRRDEPALSEGAVPPSGVNAYASYYDYSDAYGYRLPHIADAFDLPPATAHILVVNSAACPPRAQQEMARRGSENLPGIEYQAGLDVIAGNTSSPDHAFPKAASRSAGYNQGDGFSYEQTIRDAPSSFPNEKRAFWLSLADDVPSGR